MTADSPVLGGLIVPGIGEAAVPAADESIEPAAATESLVERMSGAFVPGAVVSLYEAQLALRGDWEAAAGVLVQLTVARRFTRVGEQLWVKAGAAADPYRIGARVTSPYCFAYGTALALHTGEAVTGTRVLIGSHEPFPALQHDGVTYTHAGRWPDTALVRVRARARAGHHDVAGELCGGSQGPEAVIATTPERTLVDCVARPDRAGGLDTLIGVAAALPKLDRDELNHWVHARRSELLAMRVLWVLEESGLRHAQPWLARDLERQANSTVRKPGVGRRASLGG